MKFSPPARKAPEDLTITPREFHFDYLEKLRENRYWLNDDPVVSHFFNALQATFPEGERLFIDSARDAVKAIGEENLDEKFRGEIKDFIKQEAFHGREHEGWTKALIELGYTRFEAYEQELKDLRTWARAEAPVSMRISGTAATEHFTASMAHLFLYKKPELLLGAAKPFQYLLVYHALEELEHKAVCYDLFNRLSGSYANRVSGMIFSALDLMRLVRKRHRYLLKKDGLWNRRTRLKAWLFIWGPGGMALSLLPYTLRYLKPDFHPWDTDERAKMDADYGYLFAEMEEKAIATA